MTNVAGTTEEDGVCGVWAWEEIVRWGEAPEVDEAY